MREVLSAGDVLLIDICPKSDYNIVRPVSDIIPARKAEIFSPEKRNGECRGQAEQYPGAV